MSSFGKDIAGNRPYVVIGGFGRSGSNLILKMFDVHEDTHCRNEPNDLLGASMTGLTPLFPADMPAGFDNAWPAAIDGVAGTVGARDHLPPGRKTFVRKGPLSRLGGWLQSKRRFRTIAGLGDEWPCPRLIYDRRRLATSLPVLKMMLVGAGLIEAHRVAPGQRLVHILRQPEGFLNSWFNRYVVKQPGGPEKVWADNLETLPTILEHFGADPKQCDRYSLPTLLESELWRWRYLNEMLGTLSGSDRYLKVTYEKALQHRTETTRSLFDFAGLTFSEEHGMRLQGIRNRVFSAPHQTKLDTAEIAAAVDRALGGSPLLSEL